MTAGLQRRAHNALARVRGGFVALDVRRDLVFVREHAPAVVIAGDVAPIILRGLGLAHLLVQIEAERPTKAPDHVAVLIVIDAMASVTWIEAPIVRTAGAA